MLLYKKILTKLINKNISISTAESCTGGLLAYSFVKNTGSSKIFLGGYIAYSNQLKINDLNVKKITLNNHGAVSKETAVEMINGIYKKNKAKIIYQANPEIEIVFKSDADVPFNFVAKGMASIQSLGIQKVGIITSGYDS